MERTFSAVGLGALCLTWVGAAAAQPIADHLKCFKVKDSLSRKTYTADLDGLVPQNCMVKLPAVMACVPTDKTNVMPTPPGGGGTGTPNSFFCYKVKCPKATLPTLAGQDQFGSRNVTPSTAKFLCAPLAGPPTTTTTTTTAPCTIFTSPSTTTTSSTTTTTLRFVDNGDGTVTDHQTGLQWEKKVAGTSCLHCVNDTYAWSASGSAPDGTAFTSFLAMLNGGATGVGNCASDGSFLNTGGFAGHCDWRLPTLAELGTIHDPSFCSGGAPAFCIDPVLGPPAAEYWSSTTWTGDPAWAWVVLFQGTGVAPGVKTTTDAVRAVRGGS